jgi:hypothetical protein
MLATELTNLERQYIHKRIARAWQRGTAPPSTRPDTSGIFAASSRASQLTHLPPRETPALEWRLFSARLVWAPRSTRTVRTTASSREWRIGRIYEIRGGPDHLRWFWALNGILGTPAGLRTDDRSATLEDAKAQLQESWETWLPVRGRNASGRSAD